MRKMKTTGQTMLLLFLPALLYAQVKPLSRDAQKIKNAYEALLKDINAPLNKIQFIEAFPGSKEKFVNVFYPYEKDELYAVRKEYVNIYTGIGNSFPKKVL